MSSHDIRDLVPWSLVYGALNMRHAQEVEALKGVIHDLCITILKTAMQSGEFEWTRFMLSTWGSIQPYITDEDVYAVKEGIIGRNSIAATPLWTAYITELMHERADTLLPTF